MERIEYRGWPNCYRLANKLVDLIVTGDVGPRVIRFGFVGRENEFKEFDDMVGKTGGDEWRLYGGHRLWHSPELNPRTYFPDNGPVRVEPIAPSRSAAIRRAARSPVGKASVKTDRGQTLRVTQPVEPTTGIEKRIDIFLAANAARVRLVHRLTNRGAWPIELAPWALTVMAPGGVAIFPLPPRGSQPENLAPTSLLGLWAYTDLGDPRWTWGRKFVLLRQDARATEPQKCGASAADWIAYARKGHLFVKKAQLVPAAAYPDFGCSVEAFTNHEMLEVETLGPLTTLPPGCSVEHVEDWSLFDRVPPPTSDADVEKNVLANLFPVR